jgi:hypothetical protein
MAEATVTETETAWTIGGVMVAATEIGMTTTRAERETLMVMLMRTIGARGDTEQHLSFNGLWVGSSEIPGHFPLRHLG